MSMYFYWEAIRQSGKSTGADVQQTWILIYRLLTDIGRLFWVSIPICTNKNKAFTSQGCYKI